MSVYHPYSEPGGHLVANGSYDFVVGVGGAQDIVLDNDPYTTVLLVDDWRNVSGDVVDVNHSDGSHVHVAASYAFVDINSSNTMTFLYYNFDQATIGHNSGEADYLTGAQPVNTTTPGQYQNNIVQIYGQYADISDDASSNNLTVFEHGDHTTFYDNGGLGMTICGFAADDKIDISAFHLTGEDLLNAFPKEVISDGNGGSELLPSGEGVPVGVIHLVGIDPSHVTAAMFTT